MNVLGISCHYHDAAACVYANGRVMAAAEEERFTRRKHDAAYPRNAIEYVLRGSGLTAGDIDFIVFYEKPLTKFFRILAMTTEGFPHGVTQFAPAMQSWMSEKLWVGKRIRAHLRYRGPLFYSEHHLSHAASAFYASPFDEAAVITMDAVGEWCSTTIGHGRGTRLSLLREIRFPHSLGLLYSVFTAYLGFEVNEGEYKVMGMAAYGRPRYRDEVRRLVRGFEDGSFKLDLRYFDYHRSGKPWSRAFEELFGLPCRPSSDPRELDTRCADIAASIQAEIEDAVVRIAREARRLTGSRYLCVAGGVAQNVLANSRLLVESGFDRVYVPSAPGDSGGAIGAAAYVYHALLGGQREVTPSVSQFGPDYSADEISAVLAAHSVRHENVGLDRIPEYIADRIAEGKVIGWFQGRMEFGPRALGGRSVLANPRDPRMKDILNLKIKHREPFRPFAPSIVKEDVGEFFDGVLESPFMSFVGRARDRAHATIPAAVHVDGTARVQTVDAKDQPLYHQLLRSVERRTGAPVLVNTSFNVRGEPIVCTPLDALQCFSRTEMDVLALGPFVVLNDAKIPVGPLERGSSPPSDHLVD